MKLIMIIPLLVVCVASATGQQHPIETTNPNVPIQTVASRISSLLVEAISRAFSYLFDLLDIKVRSVRFLTSLYTTDNLILLRRIMHLGLRFGNWLYSVVPDSTAQGQSQLLSILFPQVNFQNPNEEVASPNELGIDLNGTPSEKEPSVDSIVSNDDEGGSAENDLYTNYNEMTNLRRLMNSGY